MGGTFFYHPHHHGSTALQLGGGALGMLIVEDGPGEVPPFIAAMSERHMVISHLDIGLLESIQERFNDDLFQRRDRDVDEIMLVNGLEAPVVTMAAGEWERWRIVFSSVKSFYTFKFDHPSCTMQLIAKDGVYLSKAPREVKELPLYGGARCDVLIRCESSAVGVKVNLIGIPQSSKSLDLFNGTVLSINVTMDEDEFEYESLPAFEVHHPCYLASTMGVSLENVDASIEVVLKAGEINGVRFQGEGNYLQTVPVGALVELNVIGIDSHPFHAHINHFQVVEMSDYSEYIQPGDWHDTLFFAAATLKPGARVRFFTDTFTGPMLLHCHNLVHGDLGMMAQFLINGSEGGTYPHARQIDPACYADSEDRVYTLLGSPPPANIDGGGDVLLQKKIGDTLSFRRRNASVEKETPYPCDSLQSQDGISVLDSSREGHPGLASRLLHLAFTLLAALMIIAAARAVCKRHNAEVSWLLPATTTRSRPEYIELSSLGPQRAAPETAPHEATYLAPTCREAPDTTAFMYME
eukprot:CAMPEP_0171790444 /NCGR_PEP_ID=MMETSP0991-20121206/65729_1 /TAXON_ID=483369 /ORGANISM="non described non described, Strain CCMP2098" /LENGTH=522 /DNA_ID=CAMNT_0012400047 /DNA_START=485 /DNA_END=2053 /DNA_ORIENTATION=+